MANVVIMPRQGQSVESCIITSWNKKVGDTVEIVDGPLKPYVGVVDSIDTDNNSIRVVISMFGRETPVDLDLSQIRMFDK